MICNVNLVVRAVIHARKQRIVNIVNPHIFSQRIKQNVFKCVVMEIGKIRVTGSVRNVQQSVRNVVLSNYVLHVKPHFSLINKNVLSNVLKVFGEMPLKMIIQYAVNVIPDVKFVKQQDLTVLPAKMNIIISLGTNVYNVHQIV